MLGKTHMVVGIATTLAIIQPNTLQEMVLASGASAVGALICDIDVGTSGSHKDVDKICLLTIAAVVVTVILDFLFHLGIVQKILQDSNLLRIACGYLLFIGICAFGKEQPHRSFMHSFLALLILSVALGLAWPSLVPYFAIGFLSHIFMDLFNFKKVKLLYPSKKGFCLKLFHAHGLANRLFFIIGCNVLFIEVVVLLLNIISNTLKK